MVPGRGYGFTVAKSPQKPSIPAILIEGRIAVTPMPDGLRFVGAMELGSPVVSPDSPRVEGMRRNIRQFYPKFMSEVLTGDVWSGLRPCSPDGMPYIGETRNGLLVASGHAMMGMSLGPITGRLIAELATGKTPSHPLELLNPERYD